MRSENDECLISSMSEAHNYYRPFASPALAATPPVKRNLIMTCRKKRIFRRSPASRPRHRKPLKNP